jgi:hypothetical protein
MSTSRDTLLEKIEDLEHEIEELKFENCILTYTFKYINKCLERLKEFDDINAIKERIDKILKL